jgi:transcriptional regulator with XRE-family HTH domain
MKLGEKIQLLRKNHNMSQDSLAQALEINRNCLSRIETGKSEASVSVIKKLAKIFDIDIISLLDIEEKKESSKDKIKAIYNGCHYLMDDDLDFIIRIISVMREEYVKKDIK